MNIGVLVSFLSYDFLQVYMPGVELLGHLVVLYLVFYGNSTLFSLVAAPICILTNNVGEFPFVHALFSIYCL